MAHVTKEYPGAALPTVYRDDSLIADAVQLRQQVGDDKFIALLPATEALPRHLALGYRVAPSRGHAANRTRRAAVNLHTISISSASA